MKKYLIFLLLIILSVGGLYFLIVNAPSTAVKDLPVPTPTIPHLDSMKIYNLINDYRASKGLNKLVFDPSMCEFTKTRLEQTHTDWSHNGFNPEVRSAYSYTKAGENLAQSYISEKGTVDAWIKSPEHLENITDPAYTRTCIESDTVKLTPYVVQEFASY